MKRLSTALVATALLALAACGSRTTNNAAIIDTSNDVYNVSPDDLTLNDSGNASGNASSSGGNAASGNTSSSGNTSGSHAGGGNSSSSHASGNSH